MSKQLVATIMEGKLAKTSSELAKLSEQEIRRFIGRLADRDLIALLDCGSRRVVGAVAQELYDRGCKQLVSEALLAKRVRRKLGKIAAFNLCFAYGKKCPRIKEICLQYLYDRGKPVVVEALFGLVFLGEKDVIPAIEEAMKRIQSLDDDRRRAFLSAIEALRKGNPFLYEYAKYVTFAGNPWELDVEKYPEHFLKRK